VLKNILIFLISTLKDWRALSTSKFRYYFLNHSMKKLSRVAPRITAVFPALVEVFLSVTYIHAKRNFLVAKMLIMGKFFVEKQVRHIFSPKGP